MITYSVCYWIMEQFRWYSKLSIPLNLNLNPPNTPGISYQYDYKQRDLHACAAFIGVEVTLHAINSVAGFCNYYITTANSI